MRHSAVVRITHWLTVGSFFALLFSGGLIILSHPRFYWGEVGNVNMKPAFTLPVPSSRETVPTRFHRVLRDHNGPMRSLHFEAAWGAVLTGLVYGIYGFGSGHFRSNIVPAKDDWTWSAHRARALQYLRREPPAEEESESYNVLQRSSYLGVIFVLFPLIIWTGLAMSPSVTSAFPAIAWLLGGRQSARTIHFFVTILLIAFLFVHVYKVAVSGFWSRMRAMTTGYVKRDEVRR